MLATVAAMIMHLLNHILQSIIDSNPQLLCSEIHPPVCPEAASSTGLSKLMMNVVGTLRSPSWKIWEHSDLVPMTPSS